MSVRAARILIAALALFAAAPARAQYDLRLLAQTGAVVDGYALEQFVSNLHLDDTGTVLFQAWQSGGGQGLFTQNSRLIGTGSVVEGRTLAYIRSQASNGRGSVAFLADDGNEYSVFTPDRRIAGPGSTVGGKTLYGVDARPALNARGDVAFYGSYAGGYGVFTQDRFVVGTGDVIGGRALLDLSFLGADISDTGAVLFYGFYDGGRGLFTQDRLVAKIGDVVGGLTLTDFYSYRITGNGAVVYEAAYRAGGPFDFGEGLFGPDGRIVGRGDVVDGVTLLGIDGYDVNDAGQLAFIGYDNNTRALFTPSGVVLREGDSLDGKTIQGFWASPALNGRGDIAFGVEFLDYSQAVVLAAIAVPEPGPFALVGSAAALGGFALRRRARPVGRGGGAARSKRRA